MSDRDLILAGKQLLIVDDEPLLAFDLADLLALQGGSILGPFHSVGDAQIALRKATSTIDCALLDIQIGNELVWPLARQLGEAGIPYAFISAQCGPGEMPDEFAGRPCLQKPASEAAIRGALMTMLFG